jgi:hypothetical protein
MAQGGAHGAAKAAAGEAKKTPAEVQKPSIDKVIDKLQWIHRRHAS